MRATWQVTILLSGMEWAGPSGPCWQLGNAGWGSVGRGEVCWCPEQGQLEGRGAVLGCSGDKQPARSALVWPFPEGGLVGKAAHGPAPA